MYEEKLYDLGLTKYETKIYLTLLKNGPLKGGEVSKLSGVPHGRTYEVLLNLVKKGLINVINIKPKIFKIVDPKIAINNYLNLQINKLQNLKKQIPHDLSLVKKLRDKEIVTPEKIDIIWGTRNINPMLDQKYIESKKYIKQMFTYEYIRSEGIKQKIQILKKGIKMYIIATKLTKDNRELIIADVKRGCEVRYYPIEEIRVTIMDGKKSDLHVVNPKNSMDRTFIKIKSKELTHALELYFDKIWKKAQPINT